MGNLEFHHIGIACKDIEATASRYLSLGYKKGETVHDPLQDILICFLSHDSMPLVELLAPYDEDSPVNEILRKSGVSPYHTCYRVKDIEDAIKGFRKEKYLVVSKPNPACAIEGKKVAFLYNNDMGLIELLEK